MARGDVFEIIVAGDDDADRLVRKLTLFLADLRPFWPIVSRMMIGWLRLQFESEGAFWSQGRRWTPLSPSYLARKRLLWGDRPILQASGQMRQAFSRPQRIVGPSSLLLRFNDAGPEHGPVAQYHQEGDGVPRREIIGDQLPSLARYELERAAAGYVDDLLRRL